MSNPAMRHSGETQGNRDVEELPARANEGNTAWLARAKAGRGVLLVGGRSLVDFRIRVAQSHLRSDLLPSLWSIAGWFDGISGFETVPLAWSDASAMRSYNGVQTVPISAIDDPEMFPNVAVLHFTKPSMTLDEEIGRIRRDRSILDLPSHVVPWLAFAWGTSQQLNPLLTGVGLPGGAFVEAIHSLAGVELTPGLSSSASCPEAIWAAAKWWRTYYVEGAKRAVARGVRIGAPRGVYTTRRRAADVYDPAEQPTTVTRRTRRSQR